MPGRADSVDEIGETDGAVMLIGIEVGRAMRNKHNHGIEHFGYVDGPSQPLMLLEDAQKEREVGGVDPCNPTVPLGRVRPRGRRSRT